MKLDIHFHVLASGTKNIQDAFANKDLFFHWQDNQISLGEQVQSPFGLVLPLIYQDIEAEQMEKADKNKDRKISIDEYLKYVANLLLYSKEIDGLVLLAFDAVYEEDGSLNEKATDLFISNRFLSEKISHLNRYVSQASAGKKRLFMGASVNPNRPDWQKELDYVIADKNSILLKIIPSTQHIKLGNPKHKEFFARLRDAGLPLLTHAGPELSWFEGIRHPDLDDLDHVRHALDCGTTVIAAHCALPVFGTDRLPPGISDPIKHFVDLAKLYNKEGKEPLLYGDTSAFSLVHRLSYVLKLREQIEQGHLKESWLVNGTDYPIFVDAIDTPILPCGTNLDLAQKARKCNNFLDKDILTKRAFSYPDSIANNNKAFQKRLDDALSQKP